jgi:hypothetical protein
MILAISTSFCSNPTGGQSVPAIFRFGERASSTAAAASAVPFSPPRRKIDLPSMLAAALKLEIKSEPATRCGNGVRFKRLAQTSGIPSATTRLASDKSTEKLRSRRQRRR